MDCTPPAWMRSLEALPDERIVFIALHIHHPASLLALQNSCRRFRRLIGSIPTVSAKEWRYRGTQLPNGKWHGLRTMEFSNGHLLIEQTVNGFAHGRSITLFANGAMKQTSFFYGGHVLYGWRRGWNHFVGWFNDGSETPQILNDGYQSEEEIVSVLRRSFTRPKDENDR